MSRKFAAFFIALALLPGCAAPTPEEAREAVTGRITKIVPVTIQGDAPPGPGTVFTKKTESSPGARVSVLTNDNRLIEVTVRPDENPGFRVGEPVEIDGYGTKARLRRP